MNLAQIFEGWRNHLLPPEELKEVINTQYKLRSEVCLSCEHNSTPGTIEKLSTCTRCGCVLNPKIKCLSCHCPIHKWESYISGDEEMKIKTEINED